MSQPVPADSRIFMVVHRHIRRLCSFGGIPWQACEAGEVCSLSPLSCFYTNQIDCRPTVRIVGSTFPCRQDYPFTDQPLYYELLNMNASQPN